MVIHSRHQDVDPSSALASDLLGKDVVASNKIQVLYMSAGRTPQGPNLCNVTFWASGSRLGGGGDEKMYVCDRADGNILTSPKFGPFQTKKITPEGSPKDEAYRRAMGCGGIIPPSTLGYGVAMCPHCNKRWEDTRQLTGEVIYKVPTEILAQRLVAWWEKLGGDADLYIKYHHEDIRYTEMAAREGSEKARRLRGLLAYPLSHILRDTGAGAALHARFMACLSA